MSLSDLAPRDNFIGEGNVRFRPKAGVQAGLASENICPEFRSPFLLRQVRPPSFQQI